MFRNRDAPDRLYLSQGEEDIYIENCNIPQHHIEGIRFLYRQFKRKKCGVIINDPFRYGRNIQTILFVRAVWALLKKPVLILCQEGSEDDWMDRFHTWTDIAHEVIIEKSNPAVRKVVVINTMGNLPAFCGREWSVVVVDTDKNKDLNQVLKLTFKADFKIWNTDTNMKENLDKFEEIYNWLSPTESFDKSYFIPNEDSAVDVFEKAIFLDSFMEDIVIRRDNEDLSSSFERYQRNFVMPPPKPVASKKNKDATGTKIKRSKTKTSNVSVIGDTPVNICFPPSPSGPPNEKVLAAYETYDSSEDFSIENFQKKYSNDGRGIYEEKDPPQKIIDTDAECIRCNTKLFPKPDPLNTNQKLEEMDTLVFGHDTFINPVIEGINAACSGSDKDKDVHIPTREVTITKCIAEEQSTADDKSTEPPTTSGITKTSVNSGGSTQNDDKINNVDKQNTSSASDSAGNKNEQVTQTVNNPKHDDVNNIKNNSQCLTSKIDELNKMSDLDITEVASAPATNNIKYIHIKYKNNTTSTIPIIAKDKIRVSPVIISKDISGAGTKDMNSELATNSLKRNNIEDKMKECEEKIAKKFKGSFLDSLF